MNSETSGESRKQPASQSPAGDFGAAEKVCARDLIRRGLEEDVPRGDVTSDHLIPAGVTVRGDFVPRCDGVLCGLPVVAELFRELAPAVSLSPRRADGESIRAGEGFLGIRGPARSILRGERLALNFLQRLSGIATATRQIAEAIRGTGCQLYDTRKTTPAWRLLEKYAVRVGGGRNHRLNLSDFALIKDNHRKLLEGLDDREMAGWVRRLRRVESGVPVELEIDGPEELEQALAAEPDILLLDNFSLPELRQAVETVRRWSGRAPLLEASGGVSAATARAVAETGVDRIALGAVTHSAPALDIGLDLLEVLER